MSTHEDYKRSHAIKASSDRSFGVVFFVVFLIVGSLPLLRGAEPRWWALAVAAAFLVAALAAPAVLAPLNRLWTQLGLLLNRVMNPLIMAIIFYLVITPVALLVRLSGKDPLRLRLDPSARTYWLPRQPPGPDPQSMPKQF